MTSKEEETKALATRTCDFPAVSEAGISIVWSAQEPPGVAAPLVHSPTGRPSTLRLARWFAISASKRRVIRTPWLPGAITAVKALPPGLKARPSSYTPGLVTTCGSRSES